MSTKITALVWEIQFATQSQLLVALKLADISNDYGDNIWPSRNRVADEVQCSESTVKSVFRVFREIGLLHVARAGGNGPKSTTHYTLNIDLIRALHRGDVAIKGSSEHLELEWTNKGAEFDPLEPLRGQSEALRGQLTDDKGSASRPQTVKNHKLEPSRASARENLDLDLGKARLAIEITSSDPSWQAWIEHLRSSARPELADQALRDGKLTSSARWPGGGASARVGQIDYTARMVGSE
jgi:hypothetical protein